MTQPLLAGWAVPHSLVRSRRRSIGLIVDDRGLRVRAPLGVSKAQIEAVLQERRTWVEQKWGEAKARAARLEAGRLQGLPGEMVEFLGAPLLLDRLLPGQGRLPQLDAGEPGRLRLPGEPGEAWKRAAQRWLQSQARVELTTAVAQCAQRLGLATPAVRLSSAKSRWGSASSRGTISLHWRLIQLPPPLWRYVVAHEVAHLREMNHSPRFWAWVQVLDPNFESARRALKQIQLSPW